MSLNRHAARADANRGEIVRGLEAAGWFVYDLRKPVDLLIGKDGRTELVELKTDTGRLTSAQSKFLARWPGGRVVFGRSLLEVLRQLDCARVAPKALARACRSTPEAEDAMGNGGET